MHPPSLLFFSFLSPWFTSVVSSFVRGCFAHSLSRLPFSSSLSLCCLVAPPCSYRGLWALVSLTVEADPAQPNLLLCLRQLFSLPLSVNNPELASRPPTLWMMNDKIEIRSTTSLAGLGLREGRRVAKLKPVDFLRRWSARSAVKPRASSKSEVSIALVE
jgi:hypothetical protein